MNTLFPEAESPVVAFHQALHDSGGPEHPVTHLSGHFDGRVLTLQTTEPRACEPVWLELKMDAGELQLTRWRKRREGGYTPETLKLN